MPQTTTAATQPSNRYFRAAAPTPKDRTVYRLTRKGIVEPLGKDKGTTDAVFSPGCAAVVLTYSNITTPPVSSLCRADGKQIRVLEDNKAYADRAIPRLADKEFFTMRADDGTEAVRICREAQGLQFLHTLPGHHEPI